MQIEEEKCKCKWCGEDTHYTGTKECNRCWELRTRIKESIELAKKILKAIEQGEV